MNPTHIDVVIILGLFINWLSRKNSFKDRDRMAIVYRRMLMRKLGGILLLTLKRTNVTGKIQSKPVTMHKTRYPSFKELSSIYNY